MSEIINRIPQYLSLEEAKTRIQQSGRQRTAVLGPTNSGKTTLLKGIEGVVSIEAYFTKWEKAEREGQSILLASQAPETWDNPLFYDIDQFCNHWQTYTSLQSHEVNPFWKLGVDNTTRRFYRDALPSVSPRVVQHSIADLFLPQPIKVMIEQGLIDDLYLMDVAGTNIGQTSRIARRLIRQGNTDTEFQLRTIALSQVFNGNEFIRLYEQAKFGGLDITKVNFVVNNYSKSEVDAAVNKNSHSIIQRGGFISEIAPSPQDIEIWSDSWYIVEGHDCYIFVIPGEFTQVSIPMLDGNSSPISMEQITTLMDMIYNYQAYTPEQVLNQ